MVNDDTEGPDVRPVIICIMFENLGREVERRSNPFGLHVLLLVQNR